MPIGTRESKPFGYQELEDHVCDYLDNGWRVRYRDNDYEELERDQMERFIRKAP